MSIYNISPVQLTLDLVANDWQLEQDYIDYLWAHGLVREELPYNEWFIFWRS
jgi:hypothetical protein